MTSKFQKLSLAIILMLVPALMTACSDDDEILAPTVGTANVRVAHLSPDSPNVDVWVDGAKVLENVPYLAVSEYLPLPAGPYLIQVTPTGQTDPKVIDANVTVEGGMAYTIAATGKLAEIAPTILVDDPSTSGSQARVRFVHTSADAPPVDITLTDGTKLFSNVAFTQSGGYAGVPGGAYDLQVRVAGTATTVISFGSVPLANGNTYTVFATGLLEDESLAALAVLDAPGTGDTTIPLSPATAEVRVGHLSPDAPNVDVYLNDEIVSGLTNVPYETISGYLTVGAATQNVKVYVNGMSTNPVIEADLTLLPGTAYTVAATGLVGEDDLSPIVLVDDRSPASASEAKVRFVHTSPDAPAVDVTDNTGDPIFTNISFRQSSDYTTVPGGTYDLEVRLSEGGGVALEISGVVLSGDANHTIFAIGEALVVPSTLSALQTLDTN